MNIFLYFVFQESVKFPYEGIIVYHFKSYGLTLLRHELFSYILFSKNQLNSHMKGLLYIILKATD